MWAETLAPGHLLPADAGLPWLYALAFLLMGCFVSLYNYLGYRLAAAPFGFGAGWIGTLSVFYVSGMLGSGWTGRLAERYGLRRVLWVMTALMLAGLKVTFLAGCVLWVIAIWLNVRGARSFTRDNMAARL